MVSVLVFLVCGALLVVPSLLKKLRPKHPPVASIARKYVGQHVCLEVTNDGEKAEFWAIVEVKPKEALGSLPKETMFAKWEHTETARIELVSGETRNLQVARLQGSRLCGRWYIAYSLGDRAYEIPFKNDFIDDEGAAVGNNTEIVTIKLALLSDQEGAREPLRTSIALRGGDVYGGNAAPNPVVQQLPRSTRRDP